MTDIISRKDQHVDIVLNGGVSATSITTGFEHITFKHVATPELSLDEIDLTTTFLDYQLQAPFLISSMTGGPSRSETINRHIAETAQNLGIAFAVGSQRIALEQQGAAGLDKNLRRLAPSVPILANLGAAQLRTPSGSDLARRAVEMIEADAIIIHLNPLQEAVQEGGDTDWRGVLEAIANLATSSDVPVIVKEVGAAVSGDVARLLQQAGVGIIDVAGAGGTSWAAVESARATNPKTRTIAETFRNWGIPTADAIVDVRSQCPDLTIIASGGIANGIDAAKALHLGASLVGQAGPTLAAAIESPQSLTTHFEIMIAELRIACFCTASRDIAALRNAKRLHRSANG